MSRVHVYSGKFRKGRDQVVMPGLALSIPQFTRLTIDTQRDVLARGHQYGDPGVPDPDWYVSPVCRRGMSLAELERIYDRADSKISDGISRKVSSDRFEKQVQALRKSVDEININNNG